MIANLYRTKMISLGEEQISQEQQITIGLDWDTICDGIEGF